MLLSKFALSIFIVCSLSFSLAARAEEQGKPESEGGDPGKPAESASSQPWVQVENKITELASKIKAKKGTIQHLIGEKNDLPPKSPRVKGIIEQLVREHKELQKLVEEYGNNVTQLKYRFPERNAKAKRPYERVEVQSLDEMEQSLGIQGSLNRNLKRMRSQYSPGTSKSVAGEKKPDTETKPHEGGADASIEDQGAILFQK
jgi:hypothetical protein